MKHPRTLAALAGAATLALLLVASMGMTLPAPTSQDPAFRMRKSSDATSGPVVYTPGNQRSEMIGLLASIDAHLAEQNELTQRVEQVLAALLTEARRR